MLFLPSSFYEVRLVRSNKDVSKGRGEDRIAERDYPDLFAGCVLQIVCRCIAGFFFVRVICRILVVRDPYLDFSSDSVSSQFFAV